MTVKQGEDINKRFVNLNDSISILNASLTKTNDELFSLRDKNIKLDSTLKLATTNVVVSGEEIKRLNGLVKKNESSYWQEKKIWAGWMFFSFVVTVVVGALK